MNTPNQYPSAPSVRFQFRVHIHCGCGERMSITLWGTDDEADRRGRRAVMMEQATAEEWTEVSEDVHRCKSCGPVVDKPAEPIADGGEWVVVVRR